MELVALLRWGLVIALLWGCGLPLSRWIFDDAPECAIALALPVATVTIALPVYWIGRIHTTVGMAAGAVVLLGLSGMAYRRVELPDRSAYKWPVLVFLGAFTFMLGMQIGAPSVTAAGGEQFLDYSLIKAVRRAATFPIEDPWFAGERVKYYYGRAISVATIATIAGVPTRLAFNFAIATTYGTLAAAAYGVAGWIAATTDRPRRLAGIGGAVLTVASGTLATPLRLIAGIGPMEVREAVAPLILVGLRMNREDALEAVTPGEWSYWLGRYVIPGTPDVFPAWTFINGDLRPHMSSAPLLLAGVAIVMAIARTPAGRRRRLLTYGVLPAVTGWIGLVNTWSVPIVLGVLVLALWTVDIGTAGLLPFDRRWLDAVPDHQIGKPLEEASRVVTAGAVAVIVGLGAGLWGLPYYLFGLSRGEGVGFLPDGSGVGPFVLVFGGFIALFAVLIAGRVTDRFDSSRSSIVSDVGWTGGIAAILVGFGYLKVAVVVLALGIGWIWWSDDSPSPSSRPLLWVGSVGVAVATVALVGGGFTVVALVGVLGFCAWVAIDDSDQDFVLVLILAGTGLLAVNELVYAKVWPFDPNAVRWNTAYKIFHSVWVIWGVAAGVTIAEIIRERLSSPVDARSVLTVMAVVLVVAGLMTFPVAASVERAGVFSGDVTADALDSAEMHHDTEMEMIHWLDDREGTPTIATAPGTSIYQWVNAPSSLTGVPTVLGWDHEKGYRNETVYETRQAALKRLFEGTPAERSDVLDRYDVTYVYVGPNERERYDLADLDGDPRLEIATGNEKVTIYRVHPA